MNPESLEAFIRQKKEEGLSASIVSACRRYLTAFYKFLPDGKQADVESYLDFRKYLLEKGYSKETIYKYMLLLLPQGG